LREYTMTIENLFLLLAAVALMSFVFVLAVGIAQVVGFFIRLKWPDHPILKYIDDL
jgi:hypothetical protein